MTIIPGHRLGPILPPTSGRKVPTHESRVGRVLPKDGRICGSDYAKLRLALDLPETYFNDKIDQHITNFSVLHYPGQAEEPEPDQLRAGAHSDLGSLTIIYQDSATGGLQVYTREEQWIDVPLIEGSFVVNLGDLMAEWTNDRWVSTPHRVVNPPRSHAHQDRLSIGFFHQPNYDAVIECIETCCGPDNPPK